MSATQSVNINRDLVFIDQRGTGQSSPLNCPTAKPSTAGPLYTYTMFDVGIYCDGVPTWEGSP